MGMLGVKLFTTQMRYIARFSVGLFILFSFFNLLNSSYIFDNKVLGETLKRDPANSKARLQIARAQMTSGQEVEAQESLKTLLLFDPKNVYASDMLAKTLSRSQELKQDLGKTIVIVSKRPDYKAAWEKLSYLYEVIGDFDAARIAKEKAESI